MVWPGSKVLMDGKEYLVARIVYGHYTKERHPKYVIISKPIVLIDLLTGFQHDSFASIEALNKKLKEWGVLL